jgi:hypothetical protein
MICPECGAEDTHVLCFTGVRYAIERIRLEWDDGWNDVNGALNALIKMLEIGDAPFNDEDRERLLREVRLQGGSS